MTTNKNNVLKRDIEAVLHLYGFDTVFSEQKEYINHYDEQEGSVKIILSVLLKNGKRVVIKILNDSESDLLEEREKIEKQSAFSEFMRINGIRTPSYYLANGKYCQEYVYHNLPCNVTVEDWCGEEITEINTEIAYKIGVLMARMHSLSLDHHYEIGCSTLFSAAHSNDVDAFEEFCQICENESLNQSIVERIKTLRKEKLERIKSVWEKLPKAAVQGDISINNLVYSKGELSVFDYNNAGDVVLISDLVLEGLLTAYEMDLPEGADESAREQFFPALLKGYLSVRELSEEEADVAWVVYTLYHSLWFTRILYRENALENLVKRGEYASANRLLEKMLADIQEDDDGRFKKSL